MPKDEVKSKNLLIAKINAIDDVDVLDEISRLIDVDEKVYLTS